MYVNKICVQNFRILSDSTLDFKDDLCLLIGRNNSGKTSFFVLIEKFMSNSKFDFNDFSLCKREALLAIDNDTVEAELSIKLILNIEYTENDNLCHLSEFIMDLDPEKRDINILFECSISKDKLLESIQSSKNISKEKYISKYLSNYLDTKIYIFNDREDIEVENRYRLIRKDLKDVKKLIDFEIIHAKRSVSSSEEKGGTKVLSGLATSYFNNENINTPDKFETINQLIDNMDTSLNDSYNEFFDGFLSNAKDFLGLDTLKVISNLKTHEILNDSSEVTHGSFKEQLPEYLNGLGHMNILYLLLNIEMTKSSFTANNKDIKLLFIEEPEAHTHPQLQYIFARKISEIIENMSGAQAIITTHSSHIVAHHPFKNIRYMLTEKSKDGYSNVAIKNFHKDLSEKYQDETKEFQFLQQYLSIESSELFFADKAIFIEGISESMLMPYFISKYDGEKLKAEKEHLINNPKEKPTYIPLASQNVSTLQAGANAKVFKHFLEFLKIPTLIITDIDTTKLNDSRYKAHPVQKSPDNTSNQTIKYYLNAPDIKVSKEDFSKWLKKLIDNSLTCTNDYIHVAYQKLENNYHARTFEDAFININFDEIKNECQKIWGLEKLESFEEELDMYTLSENVIAKKSDFASSLLFLAHANEKEWKMPSYIKEGLKWLQEK